MTVMQRHNRAKNLKFLRNQKGLTLKALSEQVGIPKGTLATFESYGEGIGPERLTRLCEFFEISMETFDIDHVKFIKRFEP